MVLSSHMPQSTTNETPQTDLWVSCLKKLASPTEALSVVNAITLNSRNIHFPFHFSFPLPQLVSHQVLLRGSRRGF